MPRSELPILESEAARHNMVLVRDREGGYANPLKQVHIVPTSKIKAPEPDKDTPDPPKRYPPAPMPPLEEITNATPWETYCGTVIEPEGAEPVAWGSEFEIHDECVRNSGHPSSYVKRMLREARDMELRYRDSSSGEDGGDREAAMTASMATLNEVLAGRDRDWVCDDDEGDWWTYEGSFGGAFPGDLIQPRDVDMGLERLTVQIPFADTVYIHSCGVRDGCPKHISHTTAFPLTDLDALKKSLSAHEDASILFDLSELARCLIRGACAKIPVY